MLCTCSFFQISNSAYSLSLTMNQSILQKNWTKDLCCDHLKPDEILVLKKALPHLNINEDYFDIASPRQSFDSNDGFWNNV